MANETEGFIYGWAPREAGWAFLYVRHFLYILFSRETKTSAPGITPDMGTKAVGPLGAHLESGGSMMVAWFGGSCKGSFAFGINGLGRPSDPKGPPARA